MANIPEISLPSKPVFLVSDFNINDSVLGTIIVVGLITLGAILLKSRLKLVPSNFQIAIEGFVEFFYKQLISSWGSEARAKKYLPFIVSIFLFLLIANQFSIIPLVASVVNEGLPVLRTPSSDLGLTVTLAIVVILGSHIIALMSHPFRHIGNYFKFHEFLKVRSVGDLFNACLFVFLGILDIIGEFAKVLSMSCRLFGNIFAGEVMIAVITGLVTFILPMPFMLISIFSGVVQAFVFTLLAVNFMPGIVKAAEPSPAQA
jgi:F-type H+-transporting ATPase subunit a